MANYIYDGTFEGLLTAIYEAYYLGNPPENIFPHHYVQEHFLCENIQITTCTEKADKVYDAISKKISSYALRHTYYAFLSEKQDISTYIYHYLKMGFKVGKNIDRYLTDDNVRFVHDISRKVGFERHRMLGLLRFRQVSMDDYYATFEPDYNITALLAPHFTKRLSDQNWIIHDVKRNIGAIYKKNTKKWIVSDVSFKQPLGNNSQEKLFQEMWKTYFDNIAIEARQNAKLQRQFMPQRYWKHLIEKNIAAQPPKTSGEF